MCFREYEISIRHYNICHTDLIDNDIFNSEAAELSGLPEGEDFTMANFTYENSAVVSRMFMHLQNTSFPGITVSNKIMLAFDTCKIGVSTKLYLFSGK